MVDYKPSPFTTPMKLLTPTYETVKGVKKKIYQADGDLIWCSFKTYGGTERTENDVYAIEDTAKVETYFRPDITANCRVMLAESGATYDIINEPEDVNQRHKYHVFKVRRVKGGA
jgi:hypothetical protein